MASARMKAMLLLAALLAATAVVVAIAVSNAPSDEADAAADHAMTQDERCAHMPQHCQPTGGREHG